MNKDKNIIKRLDGQLCILRDTYIYLHNKHNAQGLPSCKCKECADIELLISINKASKAEILSLRQQVKDVNAELQHLKDVL